MKLGIVSTFLAKCGIATYTNFLGTELQKLGIDVTILAEKKEVLPQGFDPDFKTMLPFIECWDRNRPYDEIVKVVMREKIDTVHLQHQFGLFQFEDNMRKLFSSIKALDKTLIITLHDVTSYDFRMVTYYETIIKYADKIIVHTDLCYDLLTGVWKCPDEKVFKIIHGTKLIKVIDKKTARKKLKLPLDSEIILSWGFIWESKGILQLVEIMGEVLKAHPRAIFIHAGGLHPVIERKDYIRDIIKKAFRLGIKPENFKITGFINEEQIRLYFGCCDLIVLNYMRGSASASGAAHRALASERPVIGTDDPCITEIPRLTVQRGNNTDLYRGILTLLENKKLQEEIVEKGKKSAQETSWVNTAKKHRKVYI